MASERPSAKAARRISGLRQFIQRRERTIKRRRPWRIGPGPKAKGIVQDLRRGGHPNGSPASAMGPPVVVLAVGVRRLTATRRLCGAERATSLIRALREKPT